MTIPKVSYCWSWNQRPIKDIFKLQIRLMRNFINYVADTLSRDNEAVFLLNRFHLSTYTMGVTEQPKLEREYNVILKTLRTLPTHVFVLQLREIACVALDGCGRNCLLIISPSVSQTSSYL